MFAEEWNPVRGTFTEGVGEIGCLPNDARLILLCRHEGDTAIRLMASRHEKLLTRVMVRQLVSLAMSGDNIDCPLRIFLD